MKQTDKVPHILVVCLLRVPVALVSVVWHIFLHWGVIGSSVLVIVFLIDSPMLS